MSRWPIAGSFAQAGINPQRNMASVRPMPAPDCDPGSAARATATSWLGATL